MNIFLFIPENEHNGDTQHLIYHKNFFLELFFAKLIAKFWKKDIHSLYLLLMELTTTCVKHQKYCGTRICTPLTCHQLNRPLNLYTTKNIWQMTSHQYYLQVNTMSQFSTRIGAEAKICVNSWICTLWSYETLLQFRSWQE